MNQRTAIALGAMLASASAFAPVAVPTHQTSALQSSVTMDGDARTKSLDEKMFYAQYETVEARSQATPAPPATPPPMMANKKKPAARKRPAAAAAGHNEGIFSPLVKLSKTVLGDEKLNKVRAKAIGLHSDVIGKFVQTADTATGEVALETLFAISDKNKDGKIDETELQEFLNNLGFEWIGQKQAGKILLRASGNQDKGYITKDEFKKEAPKTLKTNLTKLAKKNGGKLGFLV